MNRFLKYIQYGGVMLLLVVLFAFTNDRNQQRNIQEAGIEFVQEQSPYIHEWAVNKLLIQNQVGVTNVGKETLVLNTVEKTLDTHKMIKDADVYLTVSGELKAEVMQRTPIARVVATTPFYIDEEGGKMPLSDTYSAHVPLVHNVSEKEMTEVFPLLKKIQEDAFLKQHIISIRKNQKGEYELGIRVYDFVLCFGKIEAIALKTKNFKAFYQKALKDKTLGKYRKVSLQFSNQVVCTKK